MFYFKAQNEATMQANVRRYLTAWAIGGHSHALPRSRSSRRSRRTFRDVHGGRHAWCKTCMSRLVRTRLGKSRFEASRLQPKESGKPCLPACRVCVRNGCRVYTRSNHSARLKDSHLHSLVDEDSYWPNKMRSRLALEHSESSCRWQAGAMVT